MPDFPNFDHWFPPDVPPERRPAPGHVLRHPGADEFARLDARLDAWCERRAGREIVRRPWFDHFARTSLLAEATADGRPLALLLGFRSADRPGEAVIQVIAVDPGMRRRGIGREIVEAFAVQLAAAGAETLSATCRPDDRIALAFFAALEFEPDAGPGSVRLYGVPAFPDRDGTGEDRVVLGRAIGD